MMTRRTDVVWAIACAQCDLGGNNRLIAPAFQRRAENRFGRTIRIDVRRVIQVDAGVEADVDEAFRLRDIGVAPGAESGPLATEGAGAEAEHGDLEARMAEIAIVHGVAPLW